jgi:hypothetical protein
MKLRLLVVCLAFAVMNVSVFAQDNPSPVNASTASTRGVGSTDVGLYVNPIGIGIRNSQADRRVRVPWRQYDEAIVLRRGFGGYELLSRAGTMGLPIRT